MRSRTMISDTYTCMQVVLKSQLIYILTIRPYYSISCSNVWNGQHSIFQYVDKYQTRFIVSLVTKSCTEGNVQFRTSFFEFVPTNLYISYLDYLNFNLCLVIFKRLLKLGCEILVFWKHFKWRWTADQSILQ